LRQELCQSITRTGSSYRSAGPGLCGITAPGFVFDIPGAVKCRSPRARAGNLEHVHGLTHGVTARPSDHQHVRMCLVKGAVSRFAEKRPIRGTNAQAKPKLRESIIRPHELAMLSSRKGTGTFCSLHIATRASACANRRSISLRRAASMRSVAILQRS
jgi:hypothetical protein